MCHEPPTNAVNSKHRAKSVGVRRRNDGFGRNSDPPWIPNACRVGAALSVLDGLACLYILSNFYNHFLLNSWGSFLF